jgi:hypothetical protein
MSAARRQQRLRERRRHGERLLQITVVEDQLVSALLAAKRLSPDQADDLDALAKEAGAVIAEWCNIWISDSSTGATARRW